MLRKIIEIDEEKCTGCGLCIPGCAEGALAIVNGKAKIVRDMYCDGLGACIGHCPEGALTIIEREAEDFDEDAAMEHVRQVDSGCPSARIGVRTVAPSPCDQANRPVTQNDSRLSHWPVQLRLIPPHAPFLKNADLLIAGDCCPVALPDFHGLLSGRRIMLGCPKFDNNNEYVERLTHIFSQAGIKSVTVLEMEVPCCSGLSRIVAQALKNAGSSTPCSRLIVTRDGRLHKRDMEPTPIAVL